MMYTIGEDHHDQVGYCCWCEPLGSVRIAGLQWKIGLDMTVRGREGGWRFLALAMTAAAVGRFALGGKMILLSSWQGQNGGAGCDLAVSRRRTVASCLGQLMAGSLSPASSHTNPSGSD